MTGGIRLSADEHVDWEVYYDYTYTTKPDSFYQLDTTTNRN
jgi:hypothetical protein